MFAKVYVLKVVIVTASTQLLHSITSPDENIKKLGSIRSVLKNGCS